MLQMGLVDRARIVWGNEEIKSLKGLFCVGPTFGYYCPTEDYVRVERDRSEQMARIAAQRGTQYLECGSWCADTDLAEWSIVTH